MGVIAFIFAVLLAFTAWAIGLSAAKQFAERDGLAGWVGVVIGINLVGSAVALCILALRA